MPGLSLDTKTPAWSYNVLTDTYQDSQGHTLSQAQVRQMVEQMIAGAKSEAAEATGALRDGHSSLDEWTAILLGLITAIHTAASIVAVGGTDVALKQAEIDLQATLASEHQFLHKFAGEIRAILVGGALAIQGGGRANQSSQMQSPAWSLRAQGYMDAALMTYERQRYEMYLTLGDVQGRRVVNPLAEHCVGCEGQAALGWMPIKSLKPLGDEECGQWCKCNMEYRAVSRARDMRGSAMDQGEE